MGKVENDVERKDFEKASKLHLCASRLLGFSALINHGRSVNECFRNDICGGVIYTMPSLGV